MRIVVFGANGGTGRELTRQALAAGHEVRAVTRRPDTFGPTGRALDVVGADVADAEAVAKAVSGTDVVLSTLGVPFSRGPVSVYSAGATAIVAAMREHGVRRVAAVSSSAAYPHHHADGGFLLNRVIQPVVTATVGRTTYADMRRAEEVWRVSGLDWTIVRPSGLFDAPRVSAYRVDEAEAAGVLTSRADLAAFLLAQATGTVWVRRVAAVTTTEGAPTMWQVLRREAFGGA